MICTHWHRCAAAELFVLICKENRRIQIRAMLEVINNARARELLSRGIFGESFYSSFKLIFNKTITCNF